MLENKVKDVIQKYNLIKEKDKVIVGVSGGPDSLCLANILYNLQSKMGFTIIIAHVNHKIRLDADSDEEFVRKYAEDRKILFEARQIDIEGISKVNKIGLEEAGRQERYRFFNEIRKKHRGTKIATAHTKYDNTETILMNIMRGAGLPRAKRD